MFRKLTAQDQQVMAFLEEEKSYNLFILPFIRRFIPRLPERNGHAQRHNIHQFVP